MSGTTLQRFDGDLYYLVGLDKDSCAGQWESLEAQGLLNPQQAWIPNLTQQMPGYRPPSDLCFPWMEISQISCQPDFYTEYQVQLVRFTKGSSGLERAYKEKNFFFLSTLYPPSNQDDVASEIFDIAAWSIDQFIDNGIILSDKPNFSKVRYAGLSIECLDQFFRYGRFDGKPPNTFDGQILSRDVVFFIDPSQFDPMRSESYNLIAKNYSAADQSNLKMLIVGLMQQGRIINPFEAIPGYTGHECNRGSWLEINPSSPIKTRELSFDGRGMANYTLMGLSPTYPLDPGVDKLAKWLLQQNQQR